MMARGAADARAAPYFYARALAARRHFTHMPSGAAMPRAPDGYMRFEAVNTPFIAYDAAALFYAAS